MANFRRKVHVLPKKLGAIPLELKNFFPDFKKSELSTQKPPDNLCFKNKKEPANINRFLLFLEKYNFSNIY